MYSFYYKVSVYLLCFIASLYGLSALDFNRFIKQGKVAQANFLYMIISLALAYLVGNLLLELVFVFN